MVKIRYIGICKIWNFFKPYLIWALAKIQGTTKIFCEMTPLTISLFEFPAKAFFKLQGDPLLILASPSKLYPYDQQGGAI